MEHDRNLRFLIATYETQSKLAAHNNNLQQSQITEHGRNYGTRSQFTEHEHKLWYAMTTYGT